MGHRETPLNGTRWPAWAATTLGMAALAVMFELVTSGAMGVNLAFATGDTTFDVYSNYMEGVAAAGYIGESQTAAQAASRAQAPGASGVAEISVRHVRMSGLCLISNQSLPVLGNQTVGLVMTAGAPVRAGFDPSDPVQRDGAGRLIDLSSDGSLTGQSLTDAVTVTDLFLKSSELSGYGRQITGMNLGESADQVNSIGTAPWPSFDTAPASGAFGLNAQQLNVAGLASTTNSMHLAGSVLLPGLKVRAYFGDQGQPTCQAQASTNGETEN